MDDPEASIQRAEGRRAADLSAAAIIAGSIVDISGVPVAVGASDLPRAAALGAVFGRLPRHAGPPMARVSFGPSPPALPEAPPDESYAGRFHVWRRGGELYLAEGSRVAGRVTEDNADFGGSPSAAFRHLVPLALGHMLGFFGRFLLHGGVIERDGRVGLVIADSGSGKSTVVIAAHLSGWRALSDDLAVARLENDRVRVGTLGLPLVFPDDLLDRPAPGSSPLAGDPRGRWTLPAPGVGEDGFVSDILVPRRANEPGGSLEALGALSVFEEATGAFVAATEVVLLRRLLPLTGRLSRLRGWQLGLAADPRARVAGVASALDRVMREAPPA